ncbi:MOSC domain-containing protein [Gryllotalpicola protaetiae]|uniref:MOSC domain-containing protein n=1 Tax=Gryllotalpicola protaetiae TaxID=2419771 RepID=A0A387BHS9_9MICO|nr:MOSC domain-containing protein [Gryllotalpicola protaetiae]AYG02218.1 MOSC domain-containing protein [Gryllotalpicola protaetiae]
MITQAPSHAPVTRAIARVTGLYRYPVKGLSPERLEIVDLEADRGFPLDRIYALARHGGLFEPGSTQGLPKYEFHMLAKDARLAALQTAIAADGETLVVAVRGHEVLRSNLSTAAGRAAAQSFFARVLDCAPGREPLIARVPGRRFTDAAPAGDLGMNAVSLINIASVRDVSERIGIDLDPLRFRANIYVDDLAAFAEQDLIGARLQIGETRFEVLSPTPRCAATEVDPTTGRRNARVPKLMMQHYGHSVLGVYLRVASAGRLRTADAVSIDDDHSYAPGPHA